MPYGSTDSFWRIGITKASVFPEPVLAAPMISRPSIAGGIQWYWIGVGLKISEKMVLSAKIMIFMIAIALILTVSVIYFLIP